MPRASAREFALLSAPIALIAIVGLYASLQPKPPEPLPPAAPLPPRAAQLTFMAREPTILEAFKGKDAICTVSYTPPFPGGPAGATPAPLSPKPWSWNFKSSLEIHIPQKQEGQKSERVEVTHYGVSSSKWSRIWSNGTSGSSDQFGNDTTEYGINVDPIPANARLIFGSTATAQSLNGTPANSLPAPLSGSWNVDPAVIKRFDFAPLPRVPHVSLISTQITSNTSNQIEGISIFHLDGPGMNAYTSLEIDWDSGDMGGIGWSTIAGRTPQNARTSATPMGPRKSLFRIVEWRVGKPTSLNPRTSHPSAQISGKVSANKLWPLEFHLAPFNFKTVKKNQYLKFTSALALPPKPSANNL